MDRESREVGRRKSSHVRRYLKADRPHTHISVTDLTGFLPVRAVGDIEEDLEDLRDALGGFQ